MTTGGTGKLVVNQARELGKAVGKFKGMVQEDTLGAASKGKSITDKDKTFIKNNSLGKVKSKYGRSSIQVQLKENQLNKQRLQKLDNAMDKLPSKPTIPQVQRSAAQIRKEMKDMSESLGSKKVGRKTLYKLQQLQKELDKAQKLESTERQKAAKVKAKVQATLDKRAAKTKAKKKSKTGKTRQRYPGARGNVKPKVEISTQKTKSKKTSQIKKSKDATKTGTPKTKTFFSLKDYDISPAVKKMAEDKSQKIKFAFAPNKRQAMQLETAQQNIRAKAKKVNTTAKLYMKRFPNDTDVQARNAIMRLRGKL
jgi:hypothetical protein